jgi:3-oxocholest-4-en-26-oate---CoA ligase
VRDAVVVGLPDARFGETICGVIEPADQAAVDPAELKAHVTARLAAYKAPRDVVVVDSIHRAANGKVDYTRLKALAVERVTGH